MSEYSLLYMPYDDIDTLCPIIVDNEKYYVFSIEDGSLSSDYDIVFFNNYFKIKGNESLSYDLNDCYQYKTNEFWYKIDLYKTFVIFDSIVLFGLVLPWLIFTQLFKKVR